MTFYAIGVLDDLLFCFSLVSIDIHVDLFDYFSFGYLGIYGQLISQFMFIPPVIDSL